MKNYLCLITSFMLISNVLTFIIPDELPSILSIIYSNIPTLKKGTDSRIGWGFRLGDRADFQIITELGPQIYTKKLVNQEDDGNTNKRSTLDNVANTLYAQRQQEKLQQQKEKPKDVKFQGENWLKKWSASMKKQQNQQQQNHEVPTNGKPGLAIGEIDAKSVIPEDDTDINVNSNEEDDKLTNS
ncbi:hypothetical protein ABEB36_007917 [Hypothenemus hampei]|uniref:Secreted protein n=1 Tax=Hypothenemus hampei TaxID=57062 RepID=A0ABD1EVK1_HYPHA